MKTDRAEWKYFIIFVRGNTETRIADFDNKDDADAEMLRIRRESRVKRGVYQLIYAPVSQSGEPDAYKRRLVNTYSPEVDSFLKELLKG